jgi:hypothetical protein
MGVRYVATKGELRVYASANPGPFEDYLSGLNVTRVRAGVCLLTMFCGRGLKLRDFRDVARELLAGHEEYRVAVCERAPGRILPHSRVLTEEPFAGMLAVDLVAMAEPTHSSPSRSLSRSARSVADASSALS